MLENLKTIVNLLRIKRELKNFAQETIAAGENRFAPQLNEKEVIELLKNATPGSTKKVTKYGMKIIIPLALVGYDMIIANSALRVSLVIYLVNKPLPAAGISADNVRG